MVVVEINVIEETSILQIGEGGLAISTRNADVVFVGLGVSLNVDDIAAPALETCSAYALSAQHFPLQAVEVVSRSHSMVGIDFNTDLGWILAFAIPAKRAMTPARKIVDFMISRDQL